MMRQTRGRVFSRKRVPWYEGVSNEDGKTVDPLMRVLLGKEPKDGRQIVKEL